MTHEDKRLYTGRLLCELPRRSLLRDDERCVSLDGVGWGKCYLTSVALCLHHARLKPKRSGWGGRPTDGMPTGSVVGRKKKMKIGSLAPCREATRRSQLVHARESGDPAHLWVALVSRGVPTAPCSRWSRRERGPSWG
jgi:hypothetical protein